MASNRSFGNGVLFALALVVVGVAVSAQEELVQPEEVAKDYHLDSDLFPVPKILEPQVTFWTDIFSRYDSNKVVLHDEKYLQVIYAVLDFTALEEADLSDLQKKKKRQEAARKAEQKYRTILLEIAGKGLSADPEIQRRLESLFSTVPGGREKYRQATERFRTQTGLKDRFETAIGRAGRYLPAMEETFRRIGVPVELTRMAFVESMFQEGARSKVGAGGIWQIMPSTGRRFLNIGLEADERFDPLTAADAAARILKGDHRSLKAWPLAITAYNSGANGMRRAVKKFGTRDPGVIFTRHKTRTFGFASRNFYTEFIAAATVYGNRSYYFPNAKPESPWEFDEFEPDQFVSIKRLAEAAELSLDEIKDFNPALNREVWNDSVRVPKGYRLRLPAGTGDRVAQAYGELDSNSKSPHQVGRRHRVRRGETLGTIARRYGSSVGALQRANRIRRANLIRTGQVLLIPSTKAYSPPKRVAVASTPTPTPKRAAALPATPTPSTASAEATHIVRSGDTLSTIARLYGTTVASLVLSNRLASSHKIFPGQKLTIPEGSRSAQSRHTVASGETLERIAQLYGTTVTALKKVNRLRNHLIYPKQVLVIP
ncbi:MAG: LysM peptidoglycan-binding domain-containing protein [Deltaproteobacteria bacterium]|nr:LysM peptidoglycan-binding domain-containing protein [Deltaproteobacteria bacterium]